MFIVSADVTGSPAGVNVFTKKYDAWDLLMLLRKRIYRKWIVNFVLVGLYVRYIPSTIWYILTNIRYICLLNKGTGSG